MTRRKDGLWQEVVTINGKRKYFYGKTKAEVLQKVRNFRETAEKENCIFSKVAEDWERIHRQQIGDKTWINYRPHYNDILSKHGNRQVQEISALDIANDLKICQTQGCSATIISTRRSLYRMILDHALISGLIQYNPAVGVKMPKGVKRNRREAPDESVFVTIMENVDKPFGLFPALLACTGLRKAEALALTWGDIGENAISITKALDYTVSAHPVLKSPKTKAGIRDVPIISVLKPLLKRPLRAKNDTLLFPGTPSNRNPEANGYMTERQYEGYWLRYCSSVGLIDENGKPLITAHQLRHGMATMGFEAGTDVLTMQAILGHASPTTTRDIYTHLSKKKQSMSIDALDKSVYKKVYKHE